MMFMPRRHGFKIVDPRRGQDWTYKFHGGSMFSTLERGCIFLHTTDRDYVWNQRLPAALIADCLKRTGSPGLFSIAPKEDFNLQGLPRQVERRVVGDSIAGYFDPVESSVAALLGAMQTKNNYLYGLNLGSCFEGADVLGEECLGSVDFGFLLRVFDQLGALCYINYDYLEIMFLFRVFAGCDALIKAILRTERGNG